MLLWFAISWIGGQVFLPHDGIRFGAKRPAFIQRWLYLVPGTRGCQWNFGKNWKGGGRDITFKIPLRFLRNNKDLLKINKNILTFIAGTVILTLPGRRETVIVPVREQCSL
ncbi:MAG: hypothetical protein NC305_02255 [Lachnospiraceae bacterium]|nr:hypothetical protein [Lachnospiraceae bacterium]